MWAARTRRAILLALTAACVSCRGSWAEMPRAGPPGADVLVATYAAHVGAPGRVLDADGNVAFGDTGLFYDQPHDVLVGRVFVSPAYVKSASAEGVANYRRVAQALNDPAIGGMFERGGGTFVLDENREAMFLVRSFPVRTTSEHDLVAGMERLRDVAAVWTARWLYRVAMIVGGHQPRPTRPVTLADPG